MLHKNLFMNFLVLLFINKCYAIEATSIISDTTSTNLVLNETNQTSSSSSNVHLMASDKLLANNGGINKLNVTNSRSIEVTQSAMSSSVSSTIIIVVSLVSVVCIVGIILGALFVMRRRFNIWRITGGSQTKNKDGEEAGDDCNGNNNEDGSSNDALTGAATDKCEIVTEVNEEKEKLNCEDQKQQQEEVVVEKEAINIVENTQPIEQIIEKKDEIKENAEPQVPQPQEPVPQQPTIPEQNSSTSLIVNVLNELSESVVQKLSAKSPNKSTTALNMDPEKQPLNSNTE